VEGEAGGQGAKRDRGIINSPEQRPRAQPALAGYRRDQGAAER